MMDYKTSREGLARDRALWKEIESLRSDVSVLTEQKIIDDAMIEQKIDEIESLRSQLDNEKTKVKQRDMEIEYEQGEHYKWKQRTEFIWGIIYEDAGIGARSMLKQEIVKRHQEIANWFEEER